MIPRLLRHFSTPLAATGLAIASLVAAQPVLVVDAVASRSVAVEARVACLALRAEATAGVLRVASTIGCRRCREARA